MRAKWYRKIQLTPIQQATVYLSLFVLLLYAYWVVTNQGIMVSVGDMGSQEVPFYQSGWEKFHSGQLVFWDWQDFYGNESFGANNYYYVLSPYAWLVFLGPKEWILQMMLVANALKYIVGGYAMMRLVHYFGIRKTSTLLIGGLSYAFSGPFITNSWYNHFNDYYSLVPFLFLYLEYFIREKRWRALPLIFGGLLAMNMYFSYTLTIVATLYVLIRYAMYHPKAVFNWRDWMQMAGRYVTSYLVGLMLSMFAFLPTVLKIMSGDRAGSFGRALSWTTLSKTASIAWQLLNSFVFPTTSIRGPEWYLEHSVQNQSSTFYCGILLLMLLPQLTRYFSKRQRAYLIGFASLLLTLMTVPILNSMMTGFANVTFRWGYSIVLFAILVVCRMVERLDRLRPDRLRISVLVLTAYSVVFMIYYEHGPFIKSVEEVAAFFRLSLIPMVVVSLLVAFILLSHQSGGRKRLLLTGMIFLHSGWMFYAFLIGGVDALQETLPATFFQNRSVITKRLDQLKSEGKFGDFDRIQLDDSYTPPIGYDYNISFFADVAFPRTYHSLYNNATNDFLDWANSMEDNPYRLHIRCTIWSQQTAMLLGVENYLGGRAQDIHRPAMFELDSQVDNGFFYKDKTQLGFIQQFAFFITPEQLADTPWVTRLETLNRALVITNQQAKEYHLTAYQPTSFEQISAFTKDLLSGNDQIVFDETDSSQVQVLTDTQVSFTATKSGELYVAPHNTLTYRINGTDVTFLDSDDEQVNHREVFYHAGDTVDIVLPAGDYTISAEPSGDWDISFWKSETPYFSELFQERRVSHSDEVLDSNHYQVTVTNLEEQLLFLPIPHSDGWTATIDDVSVAIETVHGGFMGIHVPKGQHRLKLSFVSPGFQMGVAVSLLGVLSYLALLWHDRKSQTI